MNSRFLQVLGSGSVLAFSLLGYIFAPKAFNSTLLLFILILAGVLIALYAFSKEEYPWLKGQTVKSSSLFLFAFVVVSFQIYVDVLLGNVSPDDGFLMVNQSLICKVAFLSLCGLASFLCGYFYQKGKVYVSREVSTIVPLTPLIIFTTVLFPVWFLIMGPEYFAGGYGNAGAAAGVETGLLAPYVALILNLSLYAIPFLHARNFKILGNKPTLVEFVWTLGWYNLLLVVFIILEMMSGERDVIIRSVLSMGISYLFASGFKVSKKLFCILVFSAAFLLTIIGVARSLGAGVNFSEKISIALESEKKVESVFPATQELAGSVRCLHFTVDNVPNRHSHMLGRFQLQHIASVIPTGSRWCMIAGIVPAKWQYGGPSEFVTWLVQGDDPSYGDGTAVLVDLYLDFGVPGVVLMMFVFGFWTRRFDVNLYSPYSCPTLLLVFSFMYTVAPVYISRSSILHELKHILWFFIVICIYEYAFGKKVISSNRTFSRRN